MDTFVLKFKNSQITLDITTTLAYWEMLLTTTILPSLVVVVKPGVDIWTTLLSSIRGS